jgi:CBS domain containing-hemolysin-like protein
VSTDVALLVFYLALALGVSFACSIFEAVLLSISPGYIAALEKSGDARAGAIAKLKAEVDAPLASILSLNTIAHTVGAAGVGAQSAKVFHSVPLTAISIVLTILILVVSEIVPKSLGAMYWKKLAPTVAALLGPLTVVMTLTGFVPVARWVTARLGGHGHSTNPSREEISAIAEQGAREGVFPRGESRVLSNLFRLTELRATDVMTPRTVVFALPEDTRVGDLVDRASGFRFSRIPVYRDSIDEVSGYVLRNDVLLRLAQGEGEVRLGQLKRELLAVKESLPLSELLERLLEHQAHLALVVGAYGGTTGLVTLEDVVETLIGMEIVDEVDGVADMRELARRQWERRAEASGLVVQPSESSEVPSAGDVPASSASAEAANADDADAVDDATDTPTS